jgi:hypothetical protein
MQKIRIVDLDNTISNDHWRNWLVDPSQEKPLDIYHNYHIHCKYDEVMNRYIVDESPCPVVFLTARPEYLRAETKHWLQNNHLKYSGLIMREANNHEHSVDLKRKAIWRLNNYGVKIEKAYDDRTDIIQMYRDIGVRGVLV